MNINEKTLTRGKESAEEYHLINCSNLPLDIDSENRFMLFDHTYGSMIFVWELEKLPDLTDFSIYEDLNTNNAFYFTGIHVDTTQVDR